MPGAAGRGRARPGRARLGKAWHGKVLKMLAQIRTNMFIPVVDVSREELLDEAAATPATEAPPIVYGALENVLVEFEDKPERKEEIYTKQKAEMMKEGFFE